MNLELSIMSRGQKPLKYLIFFEQPTFKNYIIFLISFLNLFSFFLFISLLSLLLLFVSFFVFLIHFTTIVIYVWFLLIFSRVSQSERRICPFLQFFTFQATWHCHLLRGSRSIFILAWRYKYWSSNLYALYNG